MMYLADTHNFGYQHTVTPSDVVHPSVI